MEAAHVLDLCDAAFCYGEIVVTPFLSLGLLMWTQDILQRINLNYIPDGGLPGAERARLVIAPKEKEIEPDQAMIDIIRLIPCQEVILPHRSVLGSILGLGIKRSVIGDIRQGKTGVYTAVAQEIAPFILENITAVGREKVRVEIAQDLTDLLPVSGEERRISVSSARLDALASSVFGLSRSNVKEIIEAGYLKQNDVIVTKPDLEVREGDIISCRGKGRFRIVRCTGKTKKGRESWEVFVYKDKTS